MLRTSLLPTTVVLIGVAIAAAGCQPGGTPAPLQEPRYANPQLVPGYLPKCPEHLENFQMVVDSPIHGEHNWKLITVKEIPLSGNLGKAPEAHDCQRLVVRRGQGREFGPLAAIFAADSLWLPIMTREGRFFARRAVATIYAFPTGYEPLHIAPGLNCLYIYSPSPNVIQGRMVQASAPADCLRPLGGDVTGPALQVRIDQAAGPRPEDIPAVARWDSDLERGGITHHIGIRCGDYWCEVGQEGFRSAPGRTREIVSSAAIKGSSTPPGNAARDRVVQNRGYYDEQVLAVKVGTTLAVGPVTATLVPHPDLGALKSEADFESGWVAVATAYLPAEVPGYQDKLNLRQGVNEVFLRNAPRSVMVAEGENVPTACTTGSPDGWWIKVKAAGTGSSRIYCGRRFSHDGHFVGLPSAVRWQWLEDDEKGWYPCGGGCCTQQ